LLGILLQLLPSVFPVEQDPSDSSCDFVGAGGAGAGAGAGTGAGAGAGADVDVDVDVDVGGGVLVLATVQRHAEGVGRAAVSGDFSSESEFSVARPAL